MKNVHEQSVSKINYVLKQDSKVLTVSAHGEHFQQDNNKLQVPKTTSDHHGDHNSLFR